MLHRRPFDQVLDETSLEASKLEIRDRAFARALATTVLRRKGELDYVLGHFIERPLPKEAGRVSIVLLTGAAQLIALRTPAHAAVDTSVDAVRRLPGGARYAGLVNAVLRKVAAQGDRLLADQDPVLLNIPEWLHARWQTTYGPDTALAIARASLTEAPLDISLKPGEDPGAWSERLGGVVLPTGSVRLVAHGRIEELPGYDDGAWWIQDAAAALAARALGIVNGRAVADLCAAPGGKTAWLAAHGAAVTAVDVSQRRLERLRTNLHRLGLTADVVAADAGTWDPGREYDAVLLDAPCTATGTIRRHPDILRLKRPEDVTRMAHTQNALLANAARMVRPGGTLVYSTCSLEPEEGEQQMAGFLLRSGDFESLPLSAGEFGCDPAWLTAAGELRVLPHQLQLASPELSGIDGFYIARLRRRA